MFRNLRGASVRRVIDRSDARIPEHAHDWPVLSLFVLGGYRNQTELGDIFIAGPSAILYRAGAAHRNTVGSLGFEQIEVEFDPAWLGGESIPSVPVSRWIGGQAAAEARVLARLCGQEGDEALLRSALQRFLRLATRQVVHKAPPWVIKATHRIGEDPTLQVSDLAREMRRHPSWLGTAYRHTTGEGLTETAARFRVERAAHLLRETDQASAEVALEAGFCDQSHMHRTFRRLLGRLPSEVRADRAGFRQVR